MTDAQEKIIVDNYQLVHGFVHKYGQSFVHEYDESVQIASLGLCYAALNYDETKSKFSTYAYHCMIREFLKIARSNKTKRRDFSTISLQTPMQNSEGDEFSCLADLIPYDEIGFQEIELKNQIEYALSKFSGKQLEIVKYFIENGKCNQKNAAKLFGVSQSYISRILKRFKKANRILMRTLYTHELDSWNKEVYL